jgi:CRISPR/Cas system-associated exonuclease Cas4 (RecB family)
MVTVSTLEHSVEECFTREFGSEPVGAVFLLKKQILSHLREFLLAYQLPLLDEDVTLLDVESKSESSVGSYRIAGTLDRIEQRGQKKYILDYKTGGSDKYTQIQFDKLNPSERESWSESIGSLQLPLYAMLYANSTSTAIDQIVPAYLFLGRHEINKEIEQGLFDEPSEAGEQMKMLQKIILGLLDEITDNTHAFDPTNTIEKECPRCPFKYICGTQWAGEYKV